MTEQNKEDNRDCLCRNWLGSCTLSAVAVILVYIVAKDLLSTAWNLQILTNGKKQNIVRMLVFKVQSNVIESSFGELGCRIIKRDSRPSRPFLPYLKEENYRNLVLLSQILKLYFWVIIFGHLDDHSLAFFFATVHMTREIHQRVRSYSVAKDLLRQGSHLSLYLSAVT